MSMYKFAPSPSYGIGEEPFVTWPNAFTDEEVEQLCIVAERRSQQEGVVDVGIKNDETRISDVRWIEQSNDTEWIYERLAYIANNINGKFYKFDVFGFNEHMQYTVYDGDKGGHYTWHMDMGSSSNTPRKMTLVLQLSDPSEYEGGDLEILAKPTIDQVKKEKGLVAAFPSYVLHRVTPVTKGIRKTLVIWVTGPSFK